jgi:hypothetical protein
MRNIKSIQKLKHNKKTKTRHHTKNKQKINKNILSGGFLTKKNIEIAELNKDKPNNWTLASQYYKATDPPHKRVFIFFGDNYNIHATVIFENIEILDSHPSIHITYEEYENLDIKTITDHMQIEPINSYHYDTKPRPWKSKTSVKLSNHSSKENIDSLLKTNYRNFITFLQTENLHIYADFNRLPIYTSQMESLRRSSSRSSLFRSPSFSSLSRRRSSRHSSPSSSSN